MPDKTVPEKEDADKTIAEDLVVTKYKMSGDIVNRVLKTILSKCVAGASVRELCEFGDKLINEETVKIFKKEKEMKKGVAFPTCISVNDCICHFSPVASEPDLALQDADVVKVDLGAHIDGFIAVVAHTMIVGSSPTVKVTGRKADVILAAHFASEAALRLLKPGNETYAVTGAVQKMCEAYKCKPIEGMLTHELRQFTIDGAKTIIQNPTELQKKEHEKFEFEVNEVYAMDVLVSTGEGVGRENKTRVTIYKKTDESYQLKLKASRTFFTEVTKNHGNMPFNLRSLVDEKRAKLGLVECLGHKLMEPFQVLYERQGEFVAHFKNTVLIMPNGPHKITGLQFEPEQYQSEHSYLNDPDLKVLMSQSINLKAAKKKKKKASKGVEAGSINTETSGEVLPDASAP